MSRWMKHLSSALIDTLAPREWGHIPPFPWESVTSGIGLEGLTATPGRERWGRGAELIDGLGNYPLFFELQLSPLLGSAYLIIAYEDLELVSKWASGGVVATDPDLQKGLVLSLLLDGALAFKGENQYEDLAPKVGVAEALCEEGHTIDIELSYNGESIWVRGICSVPLRTSLRDHFAKHPLDLSRIADDPVALSIEAGRVALSRSEWNEAELGDLLLLDTCSYTPSSGKGLLLLKTEKAPLFHVKLKEGAMKIVDIADYYQETPHMDETPYRDETHEEEELSAEESLPKTSLVDVADVPLPLTVEVAHLSLTYETLAQLKPGSVLETGLHPEQGVTLSLHGKAIARGELVEIGDMIGVRIVELS